MRMISFFLTTPQFKTRTKDVTRRPGWKNLKAGDRLQAVVKAQGLKLGEHPVKLGVIEGGWPERRPSGRGSRRWRDPSSC